MSRGFNLFFSEEDGSARRGNPTAAKSCNGHWCFVLWGIEFRGREWYWGRREWWKCEKALIFPFGFAREWLGLGGWWTCVPKIQGGRDPCVFKQRAQPQRRKQRARRELVLLRNRSAPVIYMAVLKKEAEGEGVSFCLRVGFLSSFCLRGV